LQTASNLILEQLKTIRSTSTGLTTRLRKFKSELEDILQDDQDMCAPSAAHIKLQCSSSMPGCDMSQMRNANVFTYADFVRG
jgi:hypothetical protein